jgi:hypothetical protein
VNELWDYRNAEIDFTMPTAGTYLDALGNVCPNQSILRFQAFLKVDAGKTAIDEKKLFGIDLNARSLKGYVFRQSAPKSLPKEVAHDQWYHGRFGIDVGWFYLRSRDRFGGTGIDLMIEEHLDTHVQLFFQTSRVEL